MVSTARRRAMLFCRARATNRKKASMFRIDTARLILISAPLEVLKTRLDQHDGFDAEISLPASRGDASASQVRARFPAEWPGPDALDVFPLWMAQLTTDDQFARWGGVGVMLERESLIAVGGMGCKGAPDANGKVEIGYGVNHTYQGRGYATEMAGALVGWLEAQPEVRRITAECLATNQQSARVLEKVGFMRIDTRMDDEGALVVWEYSTE
jgi:ribosomal-protein-alanine N-acetyltransferase